LPLRIELHYGKIADEIALDVAYAGDQGVVPLLEKEGYKVEKH